MRQDFKDEKDEFSSFFEIFFCMGKYSVDCGMLQDQLDNMKTKINQTSTPTI